MRGSPSTGVLVGGITFDPDETTAREVVAQLAELPGRAVVVDNSTDAACREIVCRACREGGVTLIGDGVNRGTGGGLNQLLAMARREGIEWLLYFDQDSRRVTDYGRFIEELSEIPSRVAMIGSSIEGEATARAGHEVREVRYLISSGTFMRTAAMLDVDGFDETFFLDLVDHEVCLRLRRRGWRLVADGRLLMRHSIGMGTSAVVGSITLRWHPLWRRRLMWRNSWWWLFRQGPVGAWEPGRSLALRCVETVLAAIHFRSLGCLTAAVGGTADAIARSGRRRGLRESWAMDVAGSTSGQDEGGS